MKDPIQRYEAEQAVFIIEGYFTPPFAREPNLTRQDKFIDAKMEAVKNLERQLEIVKGVDYCQFDSTWIKAQKNKEKS
jgi:hypothetical protein